MADACLESPSRAMWPARRAGRDRRRAGVIVSAVVASRLKVDASPAGTVAVAVAAATVGWLCAVVVS